MSMNDGSPVPEKKSVKMFPIFTLRKKSKNPAKDDPPVLENKTAEQYSNFGTREKPNKIAIPKKDSTSEDSDDKSANLSIK